VIQYVIGDATNPLAKGQKIIAHVCNDIGKWGAGFVMALSAKWPNTRVDYLDWYKRNDGFGLGRVLYVRVRPDIWVANMVAQAGTKTGSKGPPIRYDALDKCLADLATSAEDHNASIHMPRIGCGLAGGKWESVEPILKKNLAHLNVMVYDLGTRRG
jgi:O-acetyl-ADP-ribose deacetylase (regulator of RNase III)